jgi:hypothetical protein
MTRFLYHRKLRPTTVYFLIPLVFYSVASGIDYDIRYKDIDLRDTEALARKRREDAERKRLAEEEARKKEDAEPEAGDLAVDQEPVLNTLD